MTNEEREKTIATAIDVFEYQIKRSEDVKCGECEECYTWPFEDYCIKDVAKWLSLALEALKQEPCEDYLAEYGRNEVDRIDADIEVTAWMPLIEAYKESD